MSAQMPDLLDLLESMVETAIESGPRERVLPIRAGDDRSHIVFATDESEPGAWPYFALIDLGSVLRLWTLKGVDIDPAAAVELGRAIAAWGEARS